jgi:TrmH family RNA methyltransferase
VAGEPLITSTFNPLVKRVRSLARRKDRERAGAFFVDGIQHVWQALDQGAPVNTLVVAPELLTSEGAASRVERAVGDGIRVARVSAAVYGSISEREHPSGLGAIVSMSETPLDALVPEPDGIVVAVEDIGNPGNLGTIVRTADAVGATAVVVVGEATDPHHPAAVKASMGTLFSTPVARATSTDELFDWARTNGCSVITTSARAAHSHTDAEYALPAVLLLGSEAEGLAPDVLARGDTQVKIDMAGTATSLNVAVAAGILLYEIRRRGTSRAPA